MSILKLIQEMERYSAQAAEAGTVGFARTINEAITLLVQQGEEIAELQNKVSKTCSERDYLRSRLMFFAEMAGATDKPICVEGYKMFRGTMKIRPKTASVPAFELTGDWLYKPETKCWYGKGSSFAEDICTIVEVE